ncbi:sterol carrier family protein [Gleimia coleocanis]|uniref:sterol carrier family protein n=1 Tax=Gleimia coleocanis TaxID=103618 RepID=UPI0002EB2527|nr:sterol carrier family protein [Gleimia coleocanis]
MATRQISSEVGLTAIRSCLAVLTADPALSGEEAGADCLLSPVTPSQWKTAVRWGLQELARLAPGRAVEVRVPPAGAVQILGGTVHRRGTPPAVVEMSMEAFVALAGGVVSWTDLSEGVAHTATGKRLILDASGERADLSHLFPLI